MPGWQRDVGVGQLERHRLAAALAERRAATRFEPEVDDSAGETAPVLPDTAASAETQTPRPQQKQISPDKQAEDESYTSRLLKAKQQAWKEEENS